MNSDNPQPLSGAAPAPCTVFWKIMEIINRDGKALSDDAAMAIQTTLNHTMPPAAPVAVPAQPRQCQECNGTGEANVFRNEQFGIEKCPNGCAPPAPLPSPQEPQWRCFHCDEVFTDRELAEKHFGCTEHDIVQCLADRAKNRDRVAAELSNWHSHKQALISVLTAYASDNPKWRSPELDNEQDPCGVHELLHWIEQETWYGFSYPSSNAEAIAVARPAALAGETPQEEDANQQQASNAPFDPNKPAGDSVTELLAFIFLKSPGYDWNADPLSLTLIQGKVFAKLETLAAAALRAEAALTQAQQERDEAKKDAGWKSTHEMYRKAWIRELGGWLVPKSHEIDSLVLTTRKRCVNPLLGNCTEPHWLNKSASDEKDWQQTPHPNSGCRNWKADDSEPNPKADALRAEVTKLMEAIEPEKLATVIQLAYDERPQFIRGVKVELGTENAKRMAARVYEQVKEKI